MATVETERHGQIFVVRMNRPERLNALNHEMRSELAEAWTVFRYDPDLEVYIRDFTEGDPNDYHRNHRPLPPAERYGDAYLLKMIVNL